MSFYKTKKIQEKIIKVALSFCFFFLSGESIFAMSPHLAEKLIVQKTVNQIIHIGRTIEKNSDISLATKLSSQREALFENMYSIMIRIDTRFIKQPTLDTSSRYDFFIQKYALSCEIAALRMIIESLTRKPISEDEIFQWIPIYQWPFSRSNVWWNPDKEFVWSFTGSQRKMTWYGIYELPLSRFLTRKKISNTITNRFDGRIISPRNRMRESLEALHSGSHVLLWGDWCTTTKYEDGMVENIDNYLAKKLFVSAKNTCYRDAEDRKLRWTTPQGETIYWLSWEHAFLLLGYLGSMENPSHIIVWDTDTGRHIYPYSEWMRKWNLMDYRTLIVSENI
jgi:hypothetical protein